MTEYKFVELKSLKMSDDNGPGTIEGLRAVFDIDEGGDLIIKGAFLDTIPEYLESGFSAHSHQWNFSEAIGFPLSAYETDRGLFVKSQFHSTPDAQNIRVKAKERLKAGKTVGFSFGYSVKDSDIIRSHDYERELSLYIPSHRMEYNLKQAKRFSQVRLLKKLHVIEDSIVTAPMNKLAVATGVKCAHCSGLSHKTHVSTKGLSTGEAMRRRSEALRIRCEIALLEAGQSSYDNLHWLILKSQLRRQKMRYEQMVGR